MAKKELSQLEKDKLAQVMKDPVLWAKMFVVCYDPVKKAYGPWTARHYQCDILRDFSKKIVLRCGRRTGR